MAKRKFLGVWIERDIWLSKEMKPIEKILYAEIKSLDNESGCFASNAYFSEFFDVSERQIQTYLKRMQENGFIEVKIEDGYKRIIKIRGVKKVAGGYEENGVYNKPLNNTVNNANALLSENALEDVCLDYSDLSETVLEKKSGAGRADKRNPEIEMVYEVFAEECGVRPSPIKGGNGFDLNRGACLRLVRRYGGAEAVCGMVRAIFGAMKSDQYCKVITNPLDMEKHLGWYKLYFERKGIATEKGGVEV